MGYFARTLAPRNAVPPMMMGGSAGFSLGGGGFDGGPAAYQTFARKGYAGNEIVFRSIDLLATSAAEPVISGRRWRRERPRVLETSRALNIEPPEAIKARRLLQAAGVYNRAGAMRQDAILLANGFYEETPDHPLVRIVNNPNPYASAGQFWGTMVMDRKLGGNAYALKARYQDGLLQGAVAQLWRLRPDRVRIQQASGGEVEYLYTVNGVTQVFPASDVLQFKERSPFNDYYGMPPLMAVSRRIDIDNYMGGFLQGFFERGGTGPGAIIATNAKMNQKDKDEGRERFRRQFGGPGGWFDVLFLDNTQGMSYEQLGLNRGLRDALPNDINAVNESRISMAFGIPGSILGLLIGYESSSYANKRSDWQVFWDIVMAPLLSDMDDVMTLNLVSEFAGIDELYFDLTDIKALQEDEDKLQDRARKNFIAGGWSLPEFRLATGKAAEPPPDETFLVPANMTPMRGRSLAQAIAPVPPATPTALIEAGIRMMLPPGPGRPRLEDDEEAREVYLQAVSLKEANPGLSWEMIAGRLGVVDRTLRNYRRRFEDGDE